LHIIGGSVAAAAVKDGPAADASNDDPVVDGNDDPAAMDSVDGSSFETKDYLINCRQSIHQPMSNDH
jgi:hypothetical protein